MIGTSGQVTVASVPAGHPYVRALSVAGSTTRRLPDPHPEDPRRTAEARWWPPVMLRPSWAASAEFDLMHLHFGYDDRTPAQLAELVAVLRRRGRPLVLTVHDLHSPHQADPALLRAQLDVLVPAADEVLTLTRSAAELIRERWGRDAVVVPHPYVVDPELIDELRRRPRGVAGRARVGLAVKDLRVNCDPEPVVDALAGQPGLRLAVSIHATLAASDAPRARAVVDRLRAEAAADRLELLVHDPLPDRDLWNHVASLDVAVLPYRFGTHSGWLEMCHDVGTSVVAPDLGCYADQGADATHDGSPDSLRRAVATVLARRAEGIPGADAARRTAQQAEVAAVHEAVYERVLRRVRAA